MRSFSPKRRAITTKGVPTSQAETVRRSFGIMLVTVLIGFSAVLNITFDILMILAIFGTNPTRTDPLGNPRYRWRLATCQRNNHLDLGPDVPMAAHDNQDRISDCSSDYSGACRDQYRVCNFQLAIRLAGNFYQHDHFTHGEER